jgi:uncharacterized protein YfaS (alpha-2-macroglobulin family)
MGNRRNVLIGTMSAVIILFAGYFFYAKYKAKTIVDPAFKAYISAYTSGTISREAPIRIQLTSDAVKPTEINTQVSKKLFDFSPSIAGAAVWVDTRTIEFRPSEKMKPGETYKATFFLGSVMNVPGRFSEFNFSFSIIKQSFDVSVDGLRTPDNHNFVKQNLIGTLTTADIEDPDKVEKLLTATQNGISLSIKWVHNADRMLHSFTVDSVMRGKDSSEVVVAWDGKAIDVDYKGEKRVMVPAVGDFIFMNATAVQKENEQYIVVEFSDPLLDDQNLQGLISLYGTGGELRFAIENNVLRIYPAEKIEGTYTLHIDAAVKNGMGKTLKAAVNTPIFFDDIKPAVRMVGKGVILPSSNGLLFPFEAVNLSTVDVRIVRIFEGNVAQFLQVNNLDGAEELVRVGKIVYNKAVPLSSIKHTDFTKWNRYALDLSDLIKVEPGAIYRVTLSFRKKYSLYKCTETDTAKIQAEEDFEDAIDKWNDQQQAYYGGEGYIEDEGDYGDYDYHRRSNPCYHEFYNSEHWVTRNIIASDLGLIAKRGLDGSMLFTVTDIKTTDVMAGVTLEIYDYQHQLLKSVETNSSGIAEAKITQKPFLLVAKKGAERGYLKLDDGGSLSLSMFDVSGDKVQKGLKGFIYGERGVWRPGDSIFLMFMLEDKQKTLPASYPVSMELFDPRGQLVKKMIRSENLNGLYSFVTSTDPEAPTGSWEARVHVGNAVFTKNIRIETVMPNRLKIKFDFPKAYLAKDEKQYGTFESHWLTGPAAKGLRALIEVSLAATQTTFPKYEDYNFDDPTRKFSADKTVLFDHALDENGKATIDADIKVESAAPGELQATFVTKVFEPGGNFSIDRFTLPYHPYSYYTGVKLPGTDYRSMIYRDSNNVIKVVSVDKTGKPATGVRKMEIQVYKLEWRWWWDHAGDDITNYENSSYSKLIKSDKLDVVNGSGKWIFHDDESNWGGRYLIRITDVASGHSTGKVFYMDWPYGEEQSGESGAATMLSFTSDKNKYNVGENAILTIPTGQGSRALISVETGTKVIKTYWLEGTGKSQQFKLPITADMAPNVYASVTLMQPHSQTVNDLPIRMYGMIPLMVEDPNTHLKPVIKMADVLRPLAQVSITVSEAQQKSMTYTIAVVDEGLLDITRFKTPDPWSNFYAREALGVKTWDMFDFVIGAWGAQLERILGIGGDEGLSKPKEGNKANRFKPVVKFLGPFHLNKGETKTHTFIMPQYIGSVRTMVVAGENGAYGNAEKATPVRKPLMVLGTLPRVLGPGESVDLPVTVFAMEKWVKDVNVQIVANDMFEPVSMNTKPLKFKQVGDDIVNFKLKVKSAIGVAKVKIIATSGKERAETSIELDVRNPNPRVTEVIDTILTPGQTWNLGFDQVGVAGTNKATLEVSSLPPLNLGKRLDYLVHYPYGCVEQTTSSVFPQLYLSNLLDMSKDQKEDIDRNIKAGIQRLRLFQRPSGGMSYWPGDNEDNEWATNYAGHFLIEAEQKGYSLPQGMLDQWKKYQKVKATTWSGTNDGAMLTQAYRLYTLALAKAPELGTMNRLRENKNLPITAKWSLAAAYILAGQPEVANQITNNLATSVPKYRELSYTYGSDERDKSIILETITLMGRREKGMALLKELSADLSDNYGYMSTQTTAYALMAIAKFVGKAGLKSDMDFTFSSNYIKSTNIVTKAVVSQTNLKIKGAESGSISMKNNGKGLLYVRIIKEGVPKIGDATSAENNIKMSVVYKDLDNRNLDPANIKQGTDFYAEVTLTNPGMRGDYEEMALVQIFPSGWEILNTRMDGTENSSKSDVPRYQDIRDDRVYTFYDLRANQSKTFRIYLNASYYGSYYLPSVYTEAMYDASITARLAGKWVNVVGQDGRLSEK